MQARFVVVQFQPEKIAEAAEIMREVAATLQGYAGFHEATVLADQSTGQGYIMTLWQSEADMRASETTVYQEAMRRLAATFATAPQRTILSVVMHEHGQAH